MAHGFKDRGYRDDTEFNNPVLDELVVKALESGGTSVKPGGKRRRVPKSVHTKDENWYKKYAEKTSPAITSQECGVSDSTLQGAKKMTAETTGTTEKTAENASTKAQAFEFGKDAGLAEGIEAGRRQAQAERAAKETMSFWQKTKSFSSHHRAKLAFLLGVGTAVGAGAAADAIDRRRRQPGGIDGDQRTQM